LICQSQNPVLDLEKMVNFDWSGFFPLYSFPSFLLLAFLLSFYFNSYSYSYSSSSSTSTSTSSFFLLHSFSFFYFFFLLLLLLSFFSSKVDSPDPDGHHTQKDRRHLTRQGTTLCRHQCRYVYPYSPPLRPGPGPNPLFDRPHKKEVEEEVEESNRPSSSSSFRPPLLVMELTPQKGSWNGFA